MKHLLIIFFTISSFFSYSQVIIGQTINGELNTKNNYLTIELEGEVVKGFLTEQIVKDYKFYTIQNDEKILIIRFNNVLSSKKNSVKDIYYLNEDFKSVKKILKKQSFENIKDLNSIFVSSNFGGEWVDEKIISYNNLTELSEYIGTYKVKILKSGSYSMKSDQYGKLTITDVGITFESEIPTIDLIRTTHNKTSEFNKPSKGKFWCSVSSGYYDDLMVVIGESSGSFTTLRGKNTSTTIFTFVE